MVHQVYNVYDIGRLDSENNSMDIDGRELKPVSSFSSLCLVKGLLRSITLLGLCYNLSVPVASSDTDQYLPLRLLLLGPS